MAQTDFDIHGRIKSGTVILPDLASGIAAYRDVLGMQLVDEEPIAASMAALWGTPALEGRPAALLTMKSGASSFIRIIEADRSDDFVPTTTYGWAAFEHTAQDVFAWKDRLAKSAFEIVGPPREIEGLAYFVPMQVLGPGQEMVYLNEVRQDTPSTDLPKANSPFDHMFIAVLAAPDRETATKWYSEALQLEIGDTHTIEYTMINRAFDLPKGTQSTLTMIQQERMPIIEIDTYPESATERPVLEGSLPPGNAMITLAVNDFDELRVDWISEPKRLDGPLYQGRRTGAVRGPAREWLELIEIEGAPA